VLVAGAGHLGQRAAAELEAVCPPTPPNLVISCGKGTHPDADETERRVGQTTTGGTAPADRRRVSRRTAAWWRRCSRTPNDKPNQFLPRGWMVSTR